MAVFLKMQIKFLLLTLLMVLPHLHIQTIPLLIQFTLTTRASSSGSKKLFLNDVLLKVRSISEIEE